MTELYDILFAPESLCTARLFVSCDGGRLAPHIDDELFSSTREEN
jgi:hypothetical protein